jgi:hypothetical protein
VSSLSTLIPSNSDGPTYEAGPNPSVARLLHGQTRPLPIWTADGAPDEQEPTTACPSNAPGVREEPTPAAVSRPCTVWAGPTILIVALGVLGQASIGYQGRTTGNFSSALWYLTLCLIFIPPAPLIMSGWISDRAKIWFVL